MIHLLRRPGLFQHLRVRLVVRGNRHLARPRAAILSLLVLPRFLFEHGFVAPIPHALDDQIDIVDRDTKYQQVVIGGYGRVGHTVAVLLRSSGVPFVAFDTDSKRVAQGLADGNPVFYGDISDPGLLTAIHVERASLVVITIDQSDTALRTVSFLRGICPQVPVIARARDLEVSSRLLNAGATHAYPEAIEASLRLGATALQILRVPTDDIDLVVQGVRDWGYKPVLENEQGQDKQR